MNIYKFKITEVFIRKEYRYNGSDKDKITM